MSLSYGVKAAYCQHGLSTVDGHRDPRLAIIAFQLSPECTSAPAYILSFGRKSLSSLHLRDWCCSLLLAGSVLVFAFPHGRSAISHLRVRSLVICLNRDCRVF